MGKWRDAFESELPPVEEREYELEYFFEKPATAKQIEKAEKALGFKLPKDVREMLLEFNGVWCKSVDDDAKEIVYLDTKEIVLSTVWAGNCTSLPKDQLQKVVFIYQNNGRGVLIGVCVEDVAGFKTGQVVLLDHEVQKLVKKHKNLLEFVRKGRK